MQRKRKKYIRGSRQEREHLSGVMWERHEKPPSPLDVMSEHYYVHKDGLCFHFTNNPADAKRTTQGLQDLVQRLHKWIRPL